MPRKAVVYAKFGIEHKFYVSNFIVLLALQQQQTKKRSNKQARKQEKKYYFLRFPHIHTKINFVFVALLLPKLELMCA